MRLFVRFNGLVPVLRLDGLVPVLGGHIRWHPATTWLVTVPLILGIIGFGKFCCLSIALTRTQCPTHQQTHTCQCHSKKSPFHHHRRKSGFLCMPPKCHIASTGSKHPYQSDSIEAEFQEGFWPLSTFVKLREARTVSGPPQLWIYVR